MNEITKKWNATGLLEQLTEEEKELLAMNLERLALHVLAYDGTGKYDKVDMYVFPILRRISVAYTNENGLDIRQYHHVNPIEVLEHFTSYMNSQGAQDLISDLKTYDMIDWEAEICAMYSENFAPKFRNTPIEIKPLKYLKKHRL